MYESPLFTSVTGNTIRPGGFKITGRAMAYCNFQKDARLLDIGCGRGATVEFIAETYGVHCIGLDSSSKLINEGLIRNKGLELLCADAGELPFADGSMDGILAECSLSLVKDKTRSLHEIYRVLNKNGKFIVSDMYYREGSQDSVESPKNIDSCIANAFFKDALYEELEKSGFHLLLFEDYTQALNEIAANIILEYGSMEDFFKTVTGDFSGSECLASDIKHFKPGYFLLIAEKR
jgi:SAM-dependent methyltransferase